MRGKKMYCLYCGKENRDNVQFCTGCGKSTAAADRDTDGGTGGKRQKRPETPGKTDYDRGMFSDKSVTDSFIRKQSRGNQKKNRLADPITGEAAGSFSENSPARRKRKFRVILAVIAIILAALLILGLSAGKYVLKERQWQGYYDLGSQYLSEANYEEAIVAFTNAIEIDDRKPEAYTGRGDAYTGSAGEAVEAQNFSEAADLYEKALDDYKTAVELGDSEAEDKVQEAETNIEQIGSSSAEYTIEREDRSVYDESGQLLASWYYDKVVLEEKNEQWERINAQIQEDCDQFFGENPDYESLVLENPPLESMVYSNYSEAEVTCNENGILSIRLTRTWFMGFTANIDYYGLSYDLYTGEEVSPENILSMSSDEADDYLKEETIGYIDENPDMGWWSDSNNVQNAKQTVNEYDLQEFEFYIEDNNICLCYPTYELGPGVMGPVIVECPIPGADGTDDDNAEDTGAGVGTDADVEAENGMVRANQVSSSSGTFSGGRDIVLVLDISSSMAGEPIEETKVAAVRFIETILKEDAKIGIVTYNDDAETVSGFSSDGSRLTGLAEDIRDSGGTNIEAGLSTAYSMLTNSRAGKQVIVLMSDGEPNDGKRGEELISYADEIKESGVSVYTLGFFENISDKFSAQTLMEGIASTGCHYEVEDAESLELFFQDIADQINGQKYIHIRVACPVDVTVSYEGETLNSDETALSTRTSFGTLTFEESGEESDGENDDRVKILRLKDGTDYDVGITGTGSGTMNYTISFMDDDGEYSDQRQFENIGVSQSSRIDTVASNSEKTVLNVDTDGDGSYDLAYAAGENEAGSQVDYSYIVYLAGMALAAVVAAMTAVKVLLIVRRRKRRDFYGQK